MTYLRYRVNGKDYLPSEVKFIRRIPLSRYEKIERRRERGRKYYYENREKRIAEVKLYGKRNPEKTKKWRKKTFSKWYSKKKNKKWMVDYMKEYYHKNSKKQRSRVATYKLKDKIKLICKACQTKGDLQIHHEIYPTTKKKILEAIASGRIYYLCKKHHDEKDL